MIRRIVFHHINKCAGTTLLFKLPNAFRQDECLFVDAELQGALKDDEFGYPDYDRVSRARFIHEPSGARNWKHRLPNIATFAMFRDPVNRLYSEWMMICNWLQKNIPDTQMAKSLRQAAEAGFEHYVTTNDPAVAIQRWNGITGYLLFGAQDMIERWRASEGLFNPAFAQQALDLALANLRDLDIIGLLEEFDTSMDVLDLHLPCPPASSVQSYNTRGSRSYLPSIEPKALAAAQACTALDRIVYENACDLFQRQMTRLYAEHGTDLKVAAAKRYEHSLTGWPDWALVSMGDALHGTGWHAREINGAKISRWMGPSHIATLDIPLNKNHDLFIRARCTSFMTFEQMEVLTLKADGVPVPLESWVHLERFRYFEGSIKREALQRGAPLHLEFDCGAAHRAHHPNDPRTLGLEFCEIEVGPVSGFQRGQPGTPMKAIN